MMLSYHIDRIINTACYVIFDNISLSEFFVGCDPSLVVEVDQSCCSALSQFNQRPSNARLSWAKRWPTKK